jgi:predicted transcriptional regulator
MPKVNKPVIVPIRLDADLVRRIDRFAARVRRESAGMTISRNNAIRTLISRALSAAEKTPPFGGFTNPDEVIKGFERLLRPNWRRELSQPVRRKKR